LTICACELLLLKYAIPNAVGLNLVTMKIDYFGILCHGPAPLVSYKCKHSSSEASSRKITTIAQH